MRRARRGVMLVLCMAVMCAAGAWGQDFKHYDDWNNGYHGWSWAFYLGSGECNFQARINEAKRKLIGAGCTITRDVQKLSNAENFLAWGALHEYDFKNGEIYTVIIQQTPFEALTLFVQITDGGKGFTWMGFYSSP